MRNRAVVALGAARPDTAVAPVARVLAESAAARVRLAAVWTLCRLDHEDARAAIRKATADPDESVRQAAVHAVSVWRDRAAVAELHGILAKPSPSNRRAAAEALGRIGDPRSVPLLLAALGEKPDRVLRHSLTYALIELGDAEQTAAGLRDKSPDVRRAALIALDQMPGGRLKAETVTAELASTDPETRTVAWWIAGRHPEWGGSLAGYFRDRLAAEVPPADRDALAARLAKFAAHPEVTPVLTARLADGSEATRRLVLRAMTASGAKPAPDAWLLALATVAVDPAAKLEREAVAAARGLALPKTPPAAFRTAMAAVGRNEKLPPEVRFQALAVVPGPVEPAAFDALLGGVRLNQPFAVRSAAAEALVRSSLSGEQLVALAGQLKAVGPMEFDRCLEPFATSADERVGTALVTALADPAVRASLRSETLKARLAKFPAPVHKQAEPLFAALAADSAKQRQRLDDLLAGLKDGDARRGQAVFNSAKAACAACHAIGYQGGRVGPDLTRIGGVRSERDLLEAVVFPSASFVRSYESVRVTTADGRAFNGIVKKDAPDELTLTVSATEEVRIARGDVEEVQPGTVSVMPAGLDQQLTRQELADLIAFLKTCK